MRKKNIFDVIQILSVTIAIIFCFYNTQTVIDAVKQAMLLCYENVIPSLFVFMVIAAFMSQLKCSYLLSIPFTPVFRLLNINNRRIITYCLLSILSGFASGGYFIDKMRNEFNCSENMLGVISIITTNNSPAFVISAVGASMLNNISSGVILYCSIIISSFITAFIFSFIFPYSPVLSIKNQDKIRNSLSEALTSSVYAMINICGAVIFAFSICKVVQLYGKNLFISVAFSMLCEVTTACSFIVDSIGKNIYFICIALTFCPLSTYLQIKSIGKNSTLSLKILMLSKLMHIPLSLIILRVTVNLFPQTFAVYASGDIGVNLYWNAPHISFSFLVLTLYFVLLFDNKLGYLLFFTNNIYF